MSIADIIAASPGLQDALLAWSTFRHRHDRVPMARTGRRSRRLGNVSYKEQAARVRRHVRLARAAGWRGSIRAVIMAGTKEQER